MKKTIRNGLLGLMALTSVGCSTPRLYAPPDKFDAVFARYSSKPNPKVMVVAIDRPYSGGEQTWGYGYSVGKTTQEAEKIARKKCGKAIWHYGVFAKKTVYAINNDVVYYGQPVKVEEDSK
jgi:hypothetical protein